MAGRIRKLGAAALVLTALALPAVALADEGDGGGSDDGRERSEARTTGTCTGSSRSELRLRTDGETIRVELRIDPASRRGRWQVVALHERRIAFHGSLRARPGSGSEIRLRAVVDDWFGPDSVVVRATGPRSESCRLSATV